MNNFWAQCVLFFKFCGSTMFFFLYILLFRQVNWLTYILFWGSFTCLFFFFEFSLKSSFMSSVSKFQGLPEYYLSELNIAFQQSIQHTFLSFLFPPCSYCIVFLSHISSCMSHVCDIPLEISSRYFRQLALTCVYASSFWVTNLYAASF